MGGSYLWKKWAEYTSAIQFISILCAIILLKWNFNARVQMSRWVDQDTALFPDWIRESLVIYNILIYLNQEVQGFRITLKIDNNLQWCTFISFNTKEKKYLQ
jgi:hypothetical protein